MNSPRRNKVVIHLDQFATSGMFDKDASSKWGQIRKLLFSGFEREILFCPMPAEHFLESSRKTENFRDNLNANFLKISNGYAFKPELFITSQLMISLIRRNNITPNTFLAKLRIEESQLNPDWQFLSNNTKKFDLIMEEATSTVNQIRHSARPVKSKGNIDKLLFDVLRRVTLDKFIACLKNLLKNKFIKVRGVPFQAQPVPHWIDSIVYQLVTKHKITEKEIKLLIGHLEKYGFSQISTLDVRTSLSAMLSIKQKKENASDQLDISRISSSIQFSDILLTDKRRKLELLELELDKKYNTVILSGTSSDQESLIDLLTEKLGDVSFK